MLYFLLRILFILLWVVISPFVLGYSCMKGDITLPKLFYYFDNDEDGFDGDSLGWYSDYKGVDIRNSHGLKRWWYSYLWSVWRNPCFNLRYHPKISYDVTSPENIDYKGNTYHHNREWSYTKDKSATLKYKMTAEYNGRKATSHFYLIPFMGKDIYIRFGLKIYPRHYFESYWIDKIKEEGFPKFKDRGLYAFTIRVK